MASTSNPDSHESPQKSVYKDPDDGCQRFLLELEFVQCLANPTYIHYLAQNRYFEEEAFIGYLKYLQYWQRPDYIKFIMYPHCLFFLELLQNPTFRNAMAHPANKEVAHRQQFYFWKNYRNNRLKHILPRPLPEPATAPPTSAPPASLPLSVAPPSAPPPAPTPVTAAALSPMQYAISPGSGLAKTDPRNASVDRRKRKKETSDQLIHELRCRCPRRLRIESRIRQNLNFEIRGYEFEYGHGCGDSTKNILNLRDML